MRRSVVLTAVAALAMTDPAVATIVGGGGRPATDCLSVFDAPVNRPVSKPRNIRCVDGDSSCDTDGLANGVCQFPVQVCANSTALSACTPNRVDILSVDHGADNGHDPKFDTEFLALQGRIDSAIHPPTTALDVCTSPTDFHIRVKGPFKRAGKNVCRSTTKTVRLTTTAIVQGVGTTDRDTLKLTCIPSTCDPGVFFTGTFDRIQRQIFTQSCAKGTCHDSQSQAHGLLLEAGASYGNTVNVMPSTLAARNLGWLRITTTSPTSGDPNTSYLYHKITGDLPTPDLGARMPRGNPKLNRTLIDVIRLWIENGAPMTGWVPGTD